MIRLLRFPFRLAQVGFPPVARLGDVVVHAGVAGWSWDGPPPDLPIPEVGAADEAADVESWSVDHVVVVTPELEDTVRALAKAGADERRRATVRGRPAAFLLAGVLLEVVESNVRRPMLWGLALETTEDLDAVVERWRDAGWDVTDPHDAIQPGRAIFSVRGTGLAVMTAR